MNYYEHHLGDYLRDTAHLSMIEDGAYRRLLDAYYIREQPLPLAQREVYRLVRATSKQDREAVDQVLREFFVDSEEGWRHGRCDAEIARFAAGQPERETKKTNETLRMKRHRDERAALFRVLHEAGQHAAWNIGMNELRAMVERCGMPLPATAPATPATATHTHTPDTRHQTPEEIHTQPPTATDAGRVCGLLRKAGIADTNPGHPDLLVLLEAGATDAEFQGAAAATVDRNKGFAYLLGMLKRQRQEAARTAGQLHAGPLPVRMTPAEARAVAASPRLAAAHLRPAAPIAEQETIDVPSRIVG